METMHESQREPDQVWTYLARVEKAMADLRVRDIPMKELAEYIPNNSGRPPGMPPLMPYDKEYSDKCKKIWKWGLDALKDAEAAKASKAGRPLLARTLQASREPVSPTHACARPLWREVRPSSDFPQWLSKSSRTTPRPASVSSSCMTPKAVTLSTEDS